jgi:hypothetical protein
MVRQEQSHVNLFQAYNKHAFNNLFQPHLDNPMKKLLILALVLAPAVASAQSENADVIVSTTIRGAFTLTPQNLAFDNVQENTAVSITTAGVATNAGNGATRGQVVLSGTTGQVIYTVTSPQLNATNGTTLTIPVADVGDGATDDDLVVTLTYGRNTSSPVAYTPGTATAGANDVERSLVIGGSFTSAAGSAGHTFSSTLNITVIYD